MRPLLLLCFLSFAWSLPDSTARILLADSSGQRWGALQLTLAESLQVSSQASSKRWQSSTYAQLLAYGEMNPQWSWRTRIKVFTDISNTYYPPNFYQPHQGIPYNIQDSTRRTWDYTTASSTYELNPGAIFTAGLDYLRQGPSYRNPLALRGEQQWYRPWLTASTSIAQPAPLLFLGWDFSLRWLQYTQHTGQTLHTRGKARYIHTHLLQAKLPKRSFFGIYESIVYGSSVEPAGSNRNHNADSVDRDMSWIYALPFVPYYFAQHYNGDRDNASLGLQGGFGGLPHTDLYFELFLDDSKSPTSFFDDSWWGNKWGLSVGGHWSHKLGPLTQNLRLEWTRIEPWVYTHHQGASHQYTHYGQSLGSDLGPNSQELYSHYELQGRFWDTKLHISAVQKDTAFGSHIGDIHMLEDPTHKSFLNPTSTFAYREYGLTSQVRLWQDLFWLRGALILLQGDFTGWRTEFSSGIRW